MLKIHLLDRRHWEYCLHYLLVYKNGMINISRSASAPQMFKPAGYFLKRNLKPRSKPRFVVASIATILLKSLFPINHPETIKRLQEPPRIIGDDFPFHGQSNMGKPWETYSHQPCDLDLRVSHIIPSFLSGQTQISFFDEL